MIYLADEAVREKLYPIFKHMEDTVIASCLEGHMGQAWVDNQENPSAAQILIGAFAIFAGDAKSPSAVELVQNVPNWILAIGETEGWKRLIEEVHKDHFTKFQRYAIQKDPSHLKCEHLQGFLHQLPAGYELRRIDRDIAQKPSLQSLSDDFTGQFASIDDYLTRGTGYCILHQGEVVCGASSYSVYSGGIEIEIGTHADHRRKGLATVAAAALILDCLRKGKYPSWDAANLESVALAQKLGYELEGAYDTYCIAYDR